MLGAKEDDTWEVVPATGRNLQRSTNTKRKEQIYKPTDAERFDYAGQLVKGRRVSVNSRWFGDEAVMVRDADMQKIDWWPNGVDATMEGLNMDQVCYLLKHTDTQQEGWVKC